MSDTLIKQQIELSAIIIRADGTIEDLGVISQSDNKAKEEE